MPAGYKGCSSRQGSCVKREDDVKLCGLFRFKPFYKTIDIFDLNNRELIEFHSNGSFTFFVGSCTEQSIYVTVYH